VLWRRRFSCDAFYRLWYDLLIQINLVNKILQTQNMNIDVAASVLQKKRISSFTTSKKLDYRALLSQLKSWQKN